MTKKERQEKLQSKLATNELLYQNRQSIKRVKGVNELTDLVNQLGSVNREILGNLLGGVNQHALKSLLKSKVLKSKRAYGIGGRRVFNALYVNELNTDLLANWLLLSKSAWFLREKGLRLGQFKRINDYSDLESAVSFDDKTINQLQFKAVTDELTEKVIAKPNHTLVLVFSSLELMANMINKHNNFFTSAILDGCLTISVRQVEDSEVLTGYVLGTQQQDDGETLKLTNIDDSNELHNINFKNGYEPVENIISQINWEYDEALKRKLKQ
ncbi:hypothetical protein Lp90_1982 [Lactiplantibacillus plantarum]|uniref:hypothetical protein n=1 Tax=Lactiplantibacillus plantarum TaxID=1590 RepID=UPI0004DD881B|nr:hypothetical protein [Lactiplantibacillus plantarum]KEZ13069.1 hypothetical protein Lp90_1982 [Lactiplantibacillus plantarum]